MKCPAVDVVNHYLNGNMGREGAVLRSLWMPWAMGNRPHRWEYDCYGVAAHRSGREPPFGQDYCGGLPTDGKAHKESIGNVYRRYARHRCFCCEKVHRPRVDRSVKQAKIDSAALPSAPLAKTSEISLIIPWPLLKFSEISLKKGKGSINRWNFSKNQYKLKTLKIY